jgi:hypothetical protein
MEETGCILGQLQEAEGNINEQATPQMKHSKQEARATSNQQGTEGARGLVGVWAEA